ncbi:MAG TPA: hypothetical protein VHV77_00280 [Pirellulales bacterium]|jgi:hypothetical protein|nr:hypothetical protein [Pirellulales bacterium]
MQKGYLSQLTQHFGEGWNRFWFLPSDPFTLSVMRVLVGLLAIALVASFTPDLDRFFGPRSFLPVETVETLVAQRHANEPVWQFSYLDYIRNGRELWVAHGVSLAVLAVFTLGLYSRISAIAALIVVLSYMHRAALITSQFEPVLAFLMFYLCFGPCGAYASIDAWLRRRRLRPGENDVVAPSSTATISIRLIQVHLVAVFVMSVLAKMFGDVWWNGTAVWWLTTNSPARLVDFQFLASNKAGIYVTNAWSHAQVVYELLFPVLIWNRWARPLLIVVGVVMWTLMALLTGLLGFSAAMVVASFAFVTPDEARRLCSLALARHPESRTATT